MIPKVIHYCWLSHDPLPTEVTECIGSWKRHMGDWEIKLWNSDSFDLNSVPFVQEAVKARKWAFACDYIRLYALYNEGGVYLDSDVFVRKNMDFVLQNRAFSAIECYPQLVESIREQDLVDANGIKRNPQDRIHGIQIQAAILGSEKGHPFFRDCMSYYENRHFTVGEDGVPFETEISPIVLAGVAEKYGFRYIDCEQDLQEGLKLYSSEVFCSQPYLMKSGAVAVHCCNGSWRNVQSPLGRIFTNAKILLKRALVATGLRKEKAIRALE